MLVTVLGCGTSTGVPLIHCKCRVCRSRNPKNKRLRASVWVQHQGKSLLIDTSTDLRQQALRAKIKRVDAILFTHPHADHVGGIDEVRSFNFVQKESIPAYGNRWSVRELKSRFPYIFSPGPVEGGGIPRIELREISKATSPFRFKGLRIVPLSVKHGSQETLGYRIGDFAYVTDCHMIPEKTLNRLKGLKVLVLDCLRWTPHRTHMNLEQSLETIKRLKPRKTFLTHMGHDFDYEKLRKLLPRGVKPAHDQLRIRL